MLISNAPETKAMSDDMCVLIRHFFFPSMLICRHCEPEDVEFSGMVGVLF